MFLMTQLVMMSVAVGTNATLRRIGGSRTRCDEQEINCASREVEASIPNEMQIYVKRHRYPPFRSASPTRVTSPSEVGAQLDPGDHAFLSYGPVSNDDLLQFYGFVERENPFDTYVLQDVGKWLQEVRGLSCDVVSSVPEPALQQSPAILFRLSRLARYRQVTNPLTTESLPMNTL